MPKLPVLKPKEIVKILKKHGFMEKRQVGSHLHLVHQVRNLIATVPMHNKDLKRKTTASILRQAGLDVKDLFGR